VITSVNNFNWSKSALFVLLLLLSVQAASATTFLYSFQIPESVILAAINNFNGANANLYATYDIYIRPIQSSDVTGTSGITGTALTNYTLNSAGSPVPSGADMWDATNNVNAPNDAFGGHPTYMSVHFAFNVSDTFISLVTSNANVTGKNYQTGGTSSPFYKGEVMPGTDTFRMLISSTDSNLTSSVNFLMYITALQFTDSSATTLASKSVGKPPIELSFAGSNAPEPSTIGGALGGVLFMAAAWWRRRKESR
jgi:hypothetical protein